MSAKNAKNDYPAEWFASSPQKETVELLPFSLRHQWEDADNLAVNLSTGFHIDLKTIFVRQHESSFKKVFFRNHNNEILLVSWTSEMKADQKRVHLNHKMPFFSYNNKFAKRGGVVASEKQIERTADTKLFDVHIGVLELDKLWGRNKLKRAQRKATFEQYLTLAANVVSTAAGAPGLGTPAAKSIMTILKAVDKMDKDDVVLGSSLTFQLPGMAQLKPSSGKEVMNNALHRGYYVLMNEGFDGTDLRLSFKNDIKLVDKDGHLFQERDYVIIEVHDFPVEDGKITLLDGESASEFADKLEGKESMLDDMDPDELRKLVTELGKRIREAKNPEPQEEADEDETEEVPEGVEVEE